MTGWRSDIAQMRQDFTGEPSEGWRADIIAIARSRGYSPKSWRDTLRVLVIEYGIQPSDWRKNIRNLAQVLGMQEKRGWRESLSFTREYFEENPPSTIPSENILFCLDILPAQPGKIYKWLDNGTWNDNLSWID